MNYTNDEYLSYKTHHPKNAIYLAPYSSIRKKKILPFDARYDLVLWLQICTLYCAHPTFNPVLILSIFVSVAVHSALTANPFGLAIDRCICRRLRWHIRYPNCDWICDIWQEKNIDCTTRRVRVQHWSSAIVCISGTCHVPLLIQYQWERARYIREALNESNSSAPVGSTTTREWRCHSNATANPWHWQNRHSNIKEVRFN